MESVYEQWVRKHQEEGLDFSRGRTFKLDEYIGLAADDPCSYHYFMWRHFYDCGGPRYTAESVYPIDHIKREATESRLLIRMESQAAARWNWRQACNQINRGTLKINMQTGELTQQISRGEDSGKNYRGPFSIMTVLFFMWGFMTVFNDILIRGSRRRSRSAIFKPCWCSSLFSPLTSSVRFFISSFRLRPAIRSPRSATRTALSSAC